MLVFMYVRPNTLDRRHHIDHHTNRDHYRNRSTRLMASLKVSGFDGCDTWGQKTYNHRDLLPQVFHQSNPYYPVPMRGAVIQFHYFLWVNEANYEDNTK